MQCQTPAATKQFPEDALAPYWTTRTEKAGQQEAAKQSISYRKVTQFTIRTAP